MLQIVGSIIKGYYDEHGICIDDKFPIRNANLKPYIEERGVVDKIRLFEVDIESKHIVAKVQKYSERHQPYSGLMDYADIYYAKNFNICWRRFAVCKEMYHCMIDNSQASRVVDIFSLQKLLELLAMDTTPVTENFLPFEHEKRAELMALETLFPVEFRQFFYKIHQMKKCIKK